MYEFKNRKCIVCHEELPTGAVKPEEEIDALLEEVILVASCSNCGGGNRLVEVEDEEPTPMELESLEGLAEED